MIAGGRTKWNLPNPSHEVDASKQQLPPIAPAFVDRLDVAMLPRRRWLLGRALLRGNLTLKIAPPGVGKSTLGIEQAVAIVTGRPITDQEVHEQTKVWIYNNEDDADELKRRLAAVLQHWDIPLDEVRGRLALNSGADRPLLVAKVDRAGTVIRMPDVDACIEHIRAHQIGAFIVDPFVETHEVTENSNEQIKAVAVMFREIARAGNCAVMLVHHTAKPPQGSSDGHAGNLNTSRGASALAGVARIVQTLFSMSARDAEQHGVDDDERHLFVRLDDAKANLGLISGRARWFRRVGVTIANGDEVGVLVPDQLEQVETTAPIDVRDFHRTIVAALLAQVPEDEITLNAAAKLLAWGPHERFHRYRQTDDQRSPTREAEPCATRSSPPARRASTIIDGASSRGFPATSEPRRSPCGASSNRPRPRTSPPRPRVHGGRMMPTICSPCFARIGTNLLNACVFPDAETRNTIMEQPA